MPAKAVDPIPLLAHPSSPAVVTDFTVSVDIGTPNQLMLSYRFRGDISRIVTVPPGASAGRADRLWQHTCFEAFIRPDGAAAYFELNFNAARQWAAYQFEGYRTGMQPWALAGVPQIAWTTGPDQHGLDVTVPLPWSLAQPPAAHLALCAVMEEDNGRLSYWSARHAPGKPDFHHPDAFGTELPQGPHTKAGK